MKITRVEIYSCTTPFQKGYPSPHLLRLKAESIIIGITFENGITGAGESAPRRYVTGEDTASVASLIQDVFAPLLIGSDIDSIDDIRQTIMMLEEKCLSSHISAYLSALGAVDIALVNGLSHYLSIAVEDCLGPVVRNTISYTMPVPLLPEEMILQLHQAYQAISFDSAKVLLSPSVTENIRRLKFIRDLLGSSIPISIEANGKWSYEQAIENLEHLRCFDLFAVEQPIAPGNWKKLKELKDIFGIPIMVDESLCSLHDARLLIDAGACDFLNIKISKCGGLLKSKEIADYALSCGIRFQLGTHVGETDILNSAGLALAKVCPNVMHFEGLSALLFNDRSAGNVHNDQRKTSPEHSVLSRIPAGHHMEMIFSSQT